MKIEEGQSILSGEAIAHVLCHATDRCNADDDNAKMF
jgi:hypothetical protein